MTSQEQDFLHSLEAVSAIMKKIWDALGGMETIFWNVSDLVHELFPVWARNKKQDIFQAII